MTAHTSPIPQAAAPAPTRSTRKGLLPDAIAAFDAHSPRELVRSWVALALRYPGAVVVAVLIVAFVPGADTLAGEFVGLGLLGVLAYRTSNQAIGSMRTKGRWPRWLSFEL